MPILIRTLRPVTSTLKNYSATRTFTSSSIKMSSGTPSETARLQKESESQQSTGSGSLSVSELGIENTSIKTAPGVDLSADQKVIVGSVLDLFAGRPSLKKLGLWADSGKFSDNITQAEGRKQYEAQWYGLQKAFSSIERLSQEVTSSGNPIKMDMKTKYVVKGINKEQIITSKIEIHTDGNKITHVMDKWDGELPDGIFSKVGSLDMLFKVLNPLWWIKLWVLLAWWIFCEKIAWSRYWVAMRNLNSVVVPAFVSVPKNEEEDKKAGN